MPEEILRTAGFSAGYATPLFAAADLKLEAGNLYSLLGPNGAGKSTLLKCFAGLLRPLRGSVFLCGRPLQDWSERCRARLVASVFTREHIPYGMTVREFVSLGRIPFSGFFDSRTDLDEEAVDRALEEAGLTCFVARRMHSLSDGERSRVFVARAVSAEPRLLLLDEPTAFLDVPNILRLFRFLKGVSEKRKMAVLLSTHHVEKALRFSDALVVLGGEGRIVEGAPRDLAESSFLEWADAD